MNSTDAIVKLLRLMKNNGTAAAVEVLRKNVARYCWRRENERFDRKYKVDTGGSIETVELDIDTPNRQYGVRYEPTALKTFRSIMSNVPENLDDFTFVDFGSGKGRVLLLASHYRFKKILGVEYAKDLHEIAQRNIGIYRHRRQRCFDIQSLHVDATLFDIPPTPCMFYFFQPFTSDVMVRVLANIKESLISKPRKIFLVLLHPHPFALNAIESLASFRKMETKPLAFDCAWMYPRELAMYSSHIPAARND